MWVDWIGKTKIAKYENTYNKSCKRVWLSGATSLKRLGCQVWTYLENCQPVDPIQIFRKLLVDPSVLYIQRQKSLRVRWSYDLQHAGKKAVYLTMQNLSYVPGRSSGLKQKGKGRCRLLGSQTLLLVKLSVNLPATRKWYKWTVFVLA